MDQEPPSHDQYHLTISAPVSGQVAVGRGIHQENRSAAEPHPLEADIEALRTMLAELRRQVEENAPPEKRPSALERVDELATAVTTKKPDLTTMEYVRNWFTNNVPLLAGAVTSAIVNPLVGRLVGAAGEVIAAEFKRRFGVG